MKKQKTNTIGSKGFVGTSPDVELDTSNLTEEEKKKVVDNIRYQARKMIRHTMLTQFKQVYAKISKGMTLQEIIKEVEDKKSDMTKSARDFVLNFKEEVIQEWIDDVQGVKHNDESQVEIENTTSENLELIKDNTTQDNEK